MWQRTTTRSLFEIVRKARHAVVRGRKARKISAELTIHLDSEMGRLNRRAWSACHRQFSVNAHRSHLRRSGSCRAVVFAAAAAGLTFARSPPHGSKPQQPVGLGHPLRIPVPFENRERQHSDICLRNVSGTYQVMTWTPRPTDTAPPN
eukprot:COSAG01_NODE_1804_length_9192_cov_31.006049_9_plen_148_part_00